MYTYLLDIIKDHYQKKGPIRVGLAGMGFISNGLIIEMSSMKEEFFFPAAVIYRDDSKLARCLEACVRPYRVRYCETCSDVRMAAGQGEIAAVKDFRLAFEAGIDVMADVTGNAAFGAELAYETLTRGIHMVASPEIDICLGHYFDSLAREKGIVYTGFSGDEPGEIRNLYSYVELMGLEIIAAGKFKNFVDRYANPSSVKKWADLYGQNPIRISSFADGTKMNIEMGIVANACGLVPDVAGMNSPKADLATVTDVMRLREDGGVLSQKGVIEIVRGVEPSGGVFVVAYTKHKSLMSDLKYYKMGSGPYYLFYKPYHLCTFEMLIGIAKAVILSSAVIKPQKERTADVLVYAKKDLSEGEIIDDIGGYSFYGLLEDVSKISCKRYLPVSLATGCRVKRMVLKDEPMSLDDVDFDEDSRLSRLLAAAYCY